MKNLEEMSENTGVPIADLKDALGLIIPFYYDDIDYVKETYDSCLRGSEDERAVLYKLKGLIADKLARATTFEEVKKIFAYAPRGSEIGEMVLLKALFLCNGLNEARFVFNSSRREAIRKSAVKKIIEFYTEQ